MKTRQGNVRSTRRRAFPEIGFVDATCHEISMGFRGSNPLITVTLIFVRKFKCFHFSKNIPYLSQQENLNLETASPF